MDPVIVNTSTTAESNREPPFADWLVFVPLCVAHLLLALFIQLPFVSLWALRHYAWFLVFLAIPMAQLSLVAIWLCRGRWAAYVRFAIGIPLLIALWLVVIRRLQSPVRADLSATIMLGMMSQCATIVMVLAAWGWLRGSRQLKFGVATLLGWTAVAAICVGFWKSSPLEWSFELGGYIVTQGICNAVYAIVLLFALMPRRLTPLWVLLAVAVSAGISLVQPRLFGAALGLRDRVFLILAAAQVGCVLPSLVLLRRHLRLGRFTVLEDPTDEPH